MRRQLAVLTLFTGAVLASSFSFAVPAEKQVIPGGSFYLDKERGWFWYEEPPPEPEVIELPEPEITAAPASPATSSPEDVDPVATGPAPGSVAWIRDNLPAMRDRAIESPTDENIRAYYYAQRLMLDMGERFARRANEVVAGDPFLDEDLRSPASNASADAIARDAVVARDALLTRVSEQAALLFFFNGQDCRLCGPTIDSLKNLSNQYGFTVMPISLDGYPLPGNPFEALQYDTGLAEHLGVVTTPAIGIAVPPRGAEIVSYSAVSMETAASRILSAAHRQSLITKAELEQTERTNNIGLIDNTSLMSESSNIADNPEEFINLIRNEARKAFMSSGGNN